jgi:hypothetical protein
LPDRKLRHEISHDANKPRRRDVLCVTHPDEEKLAAISFHVDDSRQLPLIVCDVALRQDDPATNGRSLYAAIMLMTYLLEVATKDGRPTHLGFPARNASEEAAARAIGFRPLSPGLDRERDSRATGRPP